ncbi:adenylate cyclase [Cryptosporidium andersoni]|uniref:Adenylate cyclase n=1 Tax=Cryptosporidium andersoni TaxID=117008 RepID=A0A1J4MSJ9_9CRYT|nr:adenylate cyclase [Cryptosporidium andersoni]
MTRQDVSLNILENEVNKDGKAELNNNESQKIDKEEFSGLSVSPITTRVHSLLRNNYQYIFLRYIIKLVNLDNLLKSGPIRINIGTKIRQLIEKFISHPIVRVWFALLTLAVMILNEIRLLFTESYTDEAFKGIFGFIISNRVIEIILYTIAMDGYLYVYLIFDLFSLALLLVNLSYCFLSSFTPVDVLNNSIDNYYIFSQIRNFGPNAQISLTTSITQAFRFILLFEGDNIYNFITNYNSYKGVIIAQDSDNAYERKSYFMCNYNEMYNGLVDNLEHVTNKNNCNRGNFKLSKIIEKKVALFALFAVIVYPLFVPAVWISINTAAFSGVQDLGQWSNLRNQNPGDETWPNAYMVSLAYYTYRNSIGTPSKWMKLVAIQAPFPLNNNPTCNGCPKSSLEVITNAISIITSSDIPSWLIQILSLPTISQGISLIPLENFKNIRNFALRQYQMQICMRSGLNAIVSPELKCPEDLIANITAVFDITNMIQMGAGLTLGVVFISFFAFLIFTIVIQKVLDTQVYSIVNKINGTLMAISNNPLLAMNLSSMNKFYYEDNYLYNKMTNKTTKIQLNKKLKKFGSKKNEDIDKFSTNILENTFTKLGTLLAVGLGSAGANIIAQNLKDDRVNIKIPGKEITAIYGFCDIRNFTDATEVLGEKVMPFVNQVAEVVHGIVHEFGGAANKNVGDAFLFVWKSESKWVDMKNLQADMAVMSFIQVIIEIATCKKLIKYSSNRLLQERLPNYKVTLGFGLHFGWAIEGAIGSELKIDASYLSPNVNLASRLEEATKHYKVHLLFSQQVFEQLSISMKCYCRLVDCVTLKGSITPLYLYTIDIDTDLHTDISSDNNFENIEDNDESIFERTRRHEMMQQADFRIHSLFHTSAILKQMRAHLFEDFQQVYEKGIQYYLSGEWDKSRKILQYLDNECMKRWNKSDGPTQTILKYMESYQYNAPYDWKGFRKWDEK